MAIEFDCSQCGKHLRVKDELAGKQAKCPHCQKPVRIPEPAPKPDGDTYDLAPLDEDAESQRQRELARLRRAEEAILTDSTPPPPETATKPTPRDGPPLSVEELTAGEQEPAIPAEEVREQVYRYLKAMVAGQLERANDIAQRLSRSRPAAEGVIDQIAGAEMLPRTLESIPKPVIMGFLRQLRGELRR